ncbi:hypothetical protein [Ruegeria denitrificans]|uniref:hypothetical protein n=1 Tax=Ruegeria denitrificans TaxID=1715692 RepID=UPI003C7E3972
MDPPLVACEATDGMGEHDTPSSYHKADLDHWSRRPKKTESQPIAALARAFQRWSGTATELKQVLRDRFPALTEDSQSFPRSEARFGAALRRVQPVLRRQGVNIAFSREGKAGMWVIELSSR